MKYYVFNHNDFWQRPDGVDNLIYADVVFMWADWPFEGRVKELQAMGKKVIVFEHGFGSFYDYEVNNKPPIADGYLALGNSSKESLMRVGVPEDHILVAGNPVYDDIKPKKHGGNNALFVALHWVRDMVIYNSEMYARLREAYPEYNWTVKLNTLTTDFASPFGERKWNTNVNSPYALEMLKEKINDYDIIFTPRTSTFESFARLYGIPVYTIDEQESYKEPGEPGRHLMPNDYLKIGDPVPEYKPFDLTEYIKRPSVKMKDILNWIKLSSRKNG